MQEAPLDEEDGIGIKTPAFPASQFRTEEQDSSAQDENQNQPKPPQVSKLSEVATSSILLKRSNLIRSKIARLRIPSMNEHAEEEFKTPQLPPEPITENVDANEQRFSSDDDGFETAEDSLLSENDFMYPKVNIFEVFADPDFEEPISHATILERIHSHKRTRSYQLGEHLQFKWTTGAGPRIGCVRDYPSRLQFQMLEQVQLSPRSMHNSPSGLSPGLPKHFIPSKSNLCPD